MFQGHHVLYLTVLILVVGAYIRRRAVQPMPDLDWLNVTEGEWFSRQRGRIRTLQNGPSKVREAYEKYSKQNKACILPGLGHDIVLLPVNCAAWLAKHPDSVVNNLPVLQNELQVDYTFPQKRLASDPTHHKLIKGELTRYSALSVPDIVDEIAAGLRDEWGDDEVGWREVCVFQTCSRVMSRSINRILVGRNMCRNQQMLQSAQSWIRAIPMAATLLFLTPSFLRSLIAPILMYPVSKHVKSFEAIVVPEILRRQQDCDSVAEKPNPNDFLRWLMDEAKASRDPGEQTAQTIAQRLLLVNFGATHNTTATLVDVIFNLIASGHTSVEALIEESKGALDSSSGVWTKETPQQLVKYDSVVKESLRLGGIIASGIGRKVIDPDGITAPNGVYLPYGTVVAIPTWGVHRDSQIYPEPEQYLPFRFSELRSENRDDRGSDVKLSAPSISPEYGPWGLGKHACPGRFFAVLEIKLFLAYALMTYEFDFSFPSEKPSGTWIGPTAMIPPMSATIRIRRRPVKME